MHLKSVVEAEISRDEDGFLEIKQPNVKVKLSYPQVAQLLEWLSDGNGLNLEADWNDGVSKDSEY